MYIREIYSSKDVALKMSSHSFLRELSDIHFEALMFSIESFGQSSNNHTHGVYSGPVLAVVARAFYTQDKDILNGFSKVLKTGMPESIEDGAAITFRNWKLSNPSSSTALARVVYSKCESALMAFIERRMIDKLYVRNDELFPIPSNKLFP
jgi:hypothetical protein